MQLYIACNLIFNCSKGGLPIFTVHDNFLTSAAYAAEMPIYYINAFLFHKDPNRLIYDQIIRYSKFSSLMDEHINYHELLANGQHKPGYGVKKRVKKHPIYLKVNSKKDFIQ